MRNLAVLLFPLVLSGCNPFESSWTDDCEGAFKYQLKSPSSYKRVDHTVMSEDIPLETYIAQKEGITASQSDWLRRNNAQVKKWTTLVTYDADNSFGASIRDKFYCEAITTDGKEPKGGASDTEKELMIKVNGKSGLDLQTDAVKQMYKNGQLPSQN